MKRPDDLSARRGRSGNKRRIGIGAIVFIILTLISVFRGLAVFYTDFLWFDSVDLTSVWSGVLGTQIALGAVGVLAFFVLIWLNLFVVDRFAPQSISMAPEDELARRYQMFVRPRAGRVRAGVALLIAGFAGSGFYVNWSDWLLFRNGSNFGTTDPQFSRDTGFYVFQLPFITTLLSWAFYAVVLTLIIALVGHFLQGAIRPQATSNRITSMVKTHVSILLGVLALIKAAQYYFDRYRLNFSDRGVVTGANYTDVNFSLPAYLLLIGISILAAVVFFVGSRRKGWSLPVVTVTLWAVVSLLVVQVIPLAVQRFQVVPAESTKEAPFIQRNIEATRRAIGLENVEVNDFPYTDELAAADLQENAQTIRNVRLWDPTFLEPSYKRLQESRAFFRFDGIDVDRYQLNGELTQVELSVRELNIDGLAPTQRSWVNRHLQYTHGYGAAANTANAVTADGKPQFILKDLPPTGTPSIDRPQVYFGENSSEYSIVGTKQAEIDFVSDSGRDETSSYAGAGGVELSNVLRQAAFAARVGDVEPLISDLVTPESKAMYLTRIDERAQKAAPFLTFDNDPYPVILDGRIKWIHDAYTTTNNYPYAQGADTSRLENGSSLKGKSFNYMRNSVKVVTDAYDGDMTFYIADDTDPIVKAWQKAFPDLFTNSSEIPQSLREHFRYPEDMFRVQSLMYGTYHMTNSDEFYNKSDRWNIAQKPSSTASAVTTTAAPAVPAQNAAGQPFFPVETGETRIEPYYMLMRLPGEPDMSFVTLQPYVPFSNDDGRKELSAFLTVKSDPGEYGKLKAFVMPRGQQVDGPALVDGRIQQDPAIVQQLTLLNQGGSRVNFGNMLIIPIEDSLVYIRPLYVAAQQTQVPEFKKAIVVQGSKIAMEDTLQGALTKVFGSAPQTLEENRNVASSPGAPAAEPNNQRTQDLLNQANDAFGRADAALKAGDLAKYQSEIRIGVDLVTQARNQ